MSNHSWKLDRLKNILDTYYTFVPTITLHQAAQYAKDSNGKNIVVRTFSEANTTLADLITHVANEYYVEQKRAEDAEKLLCDLTPGGSEFAFNSRNCFRYIRNDMSEGLQAKVSLTIEQRKTTAYKAAMLEALYACSACGGTGEIEIIQEGLDKWWPTGDPRVETEPCLHCVPLLNALEENNE